MVTASMLSLSSCHDEKDLQNPTSALSFTTYDSKTNLCTYTLNTDDNKAIKSIYIYKNDSLIYKDGATTRSSVKQYSNVSATCKYTLDGYKIRAVIEDFGGNVTQDTLSSPVVSAVSSPKGGESLTPGTTQAITWTSNFSDKVNIQLYTDTACQTIASNVSNTGKYTWTVPTTVHAGSNYRIRVSSAVIDAAKCLSNKFTITPFITIYSPTSTVSAYSGSSLYLSWGDNLTENVKIDLYKGSSLYANIGTFISSNYLLYYNWTIPTSVPAGSDYKIRISSSTNSTVYTETPTFTISIPATQSIQITSPVTNGSWAVQNPATITWTGGNSSDNVKIELLKAGALIQTITSSTKNSGSYSWTVPDTGISIGEYSVKITDLNNTSLYATSGSFWIVASAYFSSPSTSLSLLTGDQVAVSWYINLQPLSMKLLLFDGSGSTVLTIVTLAGVKGTSSYVWTLPTLPAGSYQIVLSASFSGGITTTTGTKQINISSK